MGNFVEIALLYNRYIYKLLFFAENTFIDFGSIGDYACSPMESDDDTPKKPWPRSVIRNTNVFSVRIGPSGGRRGYSAITSQYFSILSRTTSISYFLSNSNLCKLKHFTEKPSLGIAWYINGKLIPELHVERGKTYTFIVEGGNNRRFSIHNRPICIAKHDALLIIPYIVGNLPGNYLQYHPFYITDNAEGAFGQKSEVEQKDQRIFGGINYDSEGNPLPNTGTNILGLTKLHCRHFKPSKKSYKIFSWQVLRVGVQNYRSNYTLRYVRAVLQNSGNTVRSR